MTHLRLRRVSAKKVICLTCLWHLTREQLKNMEYTMMTANFLPTHHLSLVKHVSDAQISGTNFSYLEMMIFGTFSAQKNASLSQMLWIFKHFSYFFHYDISTNEINENETRSGIQRAEHHPVLKWRFKWRNASEEANEEIHMSTSFLGARSQRDLDDCRCRLCTVVVMSHMTFSEILTFWDRKKIWL